MSAISFSAASGSPNVNATVGKSLAKPAMLSPEQALVASLNKVNAKLGETMGRHVNILA